MHDLEALAQRLKKNLKKLKPWAQAWQTNAFRLYHGDIPELRYYVDQYDSHVVVYEVFPGPPPHCDADIISCVHRSLEIPPERIHLKKRQRIKNRSEQYERQEHSKAPSVKIQVYEQSSLYLVNLSDYLDTGLFLDHRPLRRMMRKLEKARDSAPPRVLNLFSYTGSISVAAAQGGARVTSVDLSGTYLEWARENFVLNQLNPDHHDFLERSIWDFLEDSLGVGENLNDEDLFDVIIIDPPTFSNSKKSSRSFDVQRDHRKLLELSLDLLKPHGILWFSTNFSKFILDPHISKFCRCEEWTAKTVPPDFSHRSPIHRSFRITKAHHQGRIP